ncbi:hypothetical protein K431DRAFT_280631 [Polychaeton citri CBS 116435]|uniref:R3H-associated N-terminal domain-containing protein n=1 Tax=Polychaeton citri CBS 116435 TaxID=1314669 RepID=A0A9P4QJ81_9PEZI|nr:hypothetical protein K431DRAFT_280631 [Polychaeton citri CBS 116435]
MATPPRNLSTAATMPPPPSIERVEEWTVSQAADILSATSISSPTPSPARIVRGLSVTLDIPLDDHHNDPKKPAPVNHDDTSSSRPQLDNLRSAYKRREPLRRDSLKRRDALLKGKEGSRRRQRWENDRLLSNPYAEPPLPSDWQVQPTHPVHNSVPYFLAPLWDAEYARKQQQRKMAGAAGARGPRSTPKNQEEAAAAKVTQELRTKLKKAKAAKGLLQDLEKEVRGFIEAWELKEKELEKEGLIADADSEDEEIVFVGRNGMMSDERRRRREEEDLRKDKLIFQSLVDDHGASFGRYLVHAIAIYYGLKTWSVTTGNPARREAYVGLKEDPTTRRPSFFGTELPRPLWASV